MEITYPEIPAEGPWTDEQIQLAIESHHPVRIEMFGDERYWAFARLNARDLVERDLRREKELQPQFWSSVFRRIGIK